MLGPCRVFKYDGFTDGMLLRFEATYFMQSMAGPVMAPFVQNGLSTSDTLLSAASMMEMAALYENPNIPFARVYNIRDYEIFCKTVRNLTLGQIRKMLPREEECLDDDD